ncbi:MAG TPA: low molecular weight protein-tyrosine-phosphatase [Candidatus Limiplasma sp.]|nr:low molecular weight protein-tyrosine-phosphatase [Candidatus Limiplasma sp.]
MHRILFICFGNICRSPMAEFIMKDLVKKRGLEHAFSIASCATSAEEIGNPVYPPARDELARHGIGCAGKAAAQLQPQDYEAYDLLLVMDTLNYKTVLHRTDGDPAGKVHRLLEPTRRGGDIADPWFTRRFDTAYREIFAGCEAWLEQLTAQ